MSEKKKNRRYIYSFVFTLIVFCLLWVFNAQKNEIKSLENQLIEKNDSINLIQIELDACKGEIYHKNKLIEMEKSKFNRKELKEKK